VHGRSVTLAVAPLGPEQEGRWHPSITAGAWDSHTLPEQTTLLQRPGSTTDSEADGDDVESARAGAGDKEGQEEAL